MVCPKCNVNLNQATREEIEIDYCPQCSGVWLDRGELDKIIDRTHNYYVVDVESRDMNSSLENKGRNEIGDDDEGMNPDSSIQDRGTFGSQNVDEKGKKDYPRFDDEYFKRNRRPSFLKGIFDFTER